jgi:hypothetical protein
MALDHLGDAADVDQVVADAEDHGASALFPKFANPGGGPYRELRKARGH